MFLALVLAAAPVPPTPTTADWKGAIKFREFKFNPDHCGALNAIADAKKAGLSATFEPDQMRFDGQFTFQKKDCPKVTFSGHSQTAIVVRGDVLYFADFNPIATGCKVVAYDLVTGNKAWERHLEGIGPVEHSKYRNRVAMSVEKHSSENHFALVITGWEASGRYIEVLDLLSGKQLALKTYERGGLPPP
jgi:hypothetical protein